MNLPTIEPGDPEEKQDIDFGEIVHQALGEASMAWSETPTGVFQTEDVLVIAQRIIQAHESKMKGGPDGQKEKDEAESIQGN